MNIGRSDIDWKSLSHNEIDRIIAERIEADNKRIEANGGKKSKRAGYILERIAIRRQRQMCIRDRYSRDK